MYTKIYVDILGFPVYLKLFVKPYSCVKKLNDPRPFNSGITLESILLKQY